jgi:hypothetical protein
VQNFRITLSDGRVGAGEDYLAKTPLLRSHVGTQPDLLLRWNEIPVAAEAVDVVVFLHGFSQQGRDMPLAEKAASSVGGPPQRPAAGPLSPGFCRRARQKHKAPRADGCSGSLRISAIIG